jgi:hypothetical protein
VPPAITATAPEGQRDGAALVPVERGGLAVQGPAAVAAAYLGQLVADRKLRLGARTSPMAMAQADQVSGLLTELVPGRVRQPDPRFGGQRHPRLGGQLNPRLGDRALPFPRGRALSCLPGVTAVQRMGKNGS